MNNFEMDLCPPDIMPGYCPRVRTTFANGWTLSVVYRTASLDQTAATCAAVACWHTERNVKTVLLENEAGPDEVADFMAEVASRA